jgi:hypothetical protein
MSGESQRPLTDNLGEIVRDGLLRSFGERLATCGVSLCFWVGNNR